MLSSSAFKFRYAHNRYGAVRNMVRLRLSIGKGVLPNIIKFGPYGIDVNVPKSIESINVPLTI